MANIHFCSLVCPDYDADLLDHWCRHYMKYGFDSYRIYLHSPFDNYRLLHETKERIATFDFDVKILPHDKFGNGSLRTSVVVERMKELDKNDFMVVADSDEFQDVPDDYRYIANTCDYLKGAHVDAYDKTLHDACNGIPLFLQYPLRGNVEAEVLKTVDIKSLQRWPRVKKNKILCCRIKYPVALAGSHDLLPIPQGCDIPQPYPQNFDVLHYTWRSSIIKRMAGKDYFHAEHIWYFKKFFSGGAEVIDEEMRGIIDMEENLQKQKGWVPC